MKSTLRLAAVTALILSLVSCRGGGAEVSATVSGTTLGQELSDLEKARAEGLLSEDEYETIVKRSWNAMNHSI
jgi:hypothetical protein